MKKQLIRALALTTVLSAGAYVGIVQADETLDQILDEGQAATDAGVESQKRIDRLQDETDDLYQEFKSVNKEIEGMQVYNSQLERQISRQQDVMEDLDESIENVTVRERQMQPLMLRMLESLEQFVELDIPFLMDEREERIEQLYDVLDRADVTVAEKFRQILEAYQIEAEYGRNSEVYEDSLEIGGSERQVNMMMVGRIALVYQTKDQSLTGVWDQEERTWVELDPGQFANAVSNAIDTAEGGVPEMMRLPIAAPEAVQ